MLKEFLFSVELPLKYIFYTKFHQDESLFTVYITPFTKWDAPGKLSVVFKSLHVFEITWYCAVSKSKLLQTFLSVYTNLLHSLNAEQWQVRNFG